MIIIIQKKIKNQKCRKKQNSTEQKKMVFFNLNFCQKQVHNIS